MTRELRITVTFPADPPYSPDVLQQLGDEVIDAVNEIGYVGNVSWSAEDETEGCSCGQADYGAPGHDGDPLSGHREQS